MADTIRGRPVPTEVISYTQWQEKTISAIILLTDM